MTAKEYAEKYLGRRIKAKFLMGCQYGIISGYSSYHVVYEPLTPGHGNFVENARTLITLLRPIEKFYYTSLEGLPTDIKDGHSHSFDGPAPNLPDNCDDCGAVGEEKCKDGCPNKES